jgi:hypothetical protein
VRAFFSPALIWALRPVGGTSGQVSRVLVRY